MPTDPDRYQPISNAEPPALAAHEDGDDTPLLGGPAKSALGREGGATLTSCIANLANTILGTGMLAMPHAFASGGIIPGVITVVWCGFTAWLGLYFLSRCATKAPHRAASFAALSKLTFPKIGRIFDLAIFLKCFGVSISYLIIIGALMPRVVLSFAPDLEGDHWLIDRRVWILFAMLVLCPLGFLRKLDSLKFTSYVALVAVVNLIFVVIFKFFHQKGMPSRGPVPLFLLSTNFISSLPVQIFAFTCAQNIFAIHNELYVNSRKRMNFVIGASIGSAAGIYELLGILGFITFGTKVGSNIIEMYPRTPLVSICQAGIVVMVLFSYPLQVHPARASLDKVLFPPTEEDINASSFGDPSRELGEIPLGRFVVESGFILLTTFLIAIFVSDLSVVLGFVGATGSVAISFILPSIYFLSLYAHSTSTKDQRLRLLALLLLIWGIFVMVISLSLQAYHVFHKDEEKLSSLDVLHVLGGGSLGGVAVGGEELGGGLGEGIAAPVRWRW